MQGDTRCIECGGVVEIHQLSRTERKEECLECGRRSHWRICAECGEVNGPRRVICMECGIPFDRKEIMMASSSMDAARPARAAPR